MALLTRTRSKHLALSAYFRSWLQMLHLFFRPPWRKVLVRFANYAGQAFLLSNAQPHGIGSTRIENPKNDAAKIAGSNQFRVFSRIINALCSPAVSRSSQQLVPNQIPFLVTINHDHSRFKLSKIGLVDDQDRIRTVMRCHREAVRKHHTPVGVGLSDFFSIRYGFTEGNVRHWGRDTGASRNELRSTSQETCDYGDEEERLRFHAPDYALQSPSPVFGLPSIHTFFSTDVAESGNVIHDLVDI